MLDFERRVARSKCASELSVARRCQSRKRASTVTVHGLGGLPPGLGGLPPPSTRAPSFATVPPLFRSSVAGIDSLVKHAPHSGRDVLMRCLPRCHPRRWKEADLQACSNPVCAFPGSLVKPSLAQPCESSVSGVPEMLTACVPRCVPRNLPTETTLRLRSATRRTRVMMRPARYLWLRRRSDKRCPCLDPESVEPERHRVPRTSRWRRARCLRAAHARRQRSDLKAARISSLNSSGSSQAAKCPPLSTSLK